MGPHNNLNLPSQELSHFGYGIQKGISHLAGGIGLVDLRAWWKRQE